MKMKKLAMLVAATACAVSLNAATLKWGSAVCESDGATAVTAGQMVYLIYSATAFSGLTSTYDSTAGTTDNGGKMVSSYTITAQNATEYVFKTDFNRTD